MGSEKRAFRTLESYAAELVSRDAVRPFLESRGYVVVEDARRKVGKGESQIVSAHAPDGSYLRMRVRLCWRRGGRRATEKLYAATQLRARTIDGDWDKTLDQLVARDAEDSITHTLLLQRDGMDIVYAAQIPRQALKAIWLRQRDVSAELIAEGALGRRQKNHAMNGESPTIYLQDDRDARSPEVAKVLWGWPGVIDVARLPLTAAPDVPDDTLDDYPGLMDALAGSDGAGRVQSVRSGVRRDPLVREQVRKRANLRCERPSCGVSRPYACFLDVHHLLGAEKSDRAWTCVALCPNCHRDAHVAPDAAEINAELLIYADRFRPSDVPLAAEAQQLMGVTTSA
jgi:5-methylcytosine-specific restriction enzyme A